MSSYGNPPEDPYGQQPGGQPDPYGQQPAYGQSPYGQQPYGAPSAGVGYAHWGKRVGSYLIDSLLMMAGMIPAFIGSAMMQDPGTATVGGLLTAIGYILGLGIFVWNTCLKQGRTGYSVGKGVLGIKLIKFDTGQPIGPGMAFVRQIAHILDGIPCYIGYLWPLWDSKRQTFADKVLSTVVIDQPQH